VKCSSRTSFYPCSSTASLSAFAQHSTRSKLAIFALQDEVSGRFRVNVTVQRTGLKAVFV